jgi:hypothetical protein
MVGAVIAIALLFTSGISRLSVEVAVITGLLTSISVVLFGGKHPDKRK